MSSWSQISTFQMTNILFGVLNTLHTLLQYLLLANLDSNYERNKTCTLALFDKALGAKLSLQLILKTPVQAQTNITADLNSLS